MLYCYKNQIHGFKEQCTGTLYLPEVTTEVENQYLDFLNDPSFLRVKKVFILSFESENNVNVNNVYYRNSLL